MTRSWQSDYIVIGGGTAGCILAARLSELPSRTVTLIEAGPDYVPESAVPSQLRLLERISLRHDWDYVSEPEPFLADRRIRLPRGKLVGGCSRLHLGLALKPAPADFEKWPHSTATAWAWSDVAPYFQRVCESGLTAHLRSREKWSETQRAFFESSLAAGFAETTATSGDGIGVMACPVAEQRGVRVNAAASYLTPEVRDRPNMRIVSDTIVGSVGFESNRARRVNFWSREGEALSVEASQGVVLAAGVVGTPGILQRSGIGDAAILRPLGIDVLHDLGRVGKNLQDHPVAIVDVPTRHGVRLPPDHIFDVLLKASSAISGPESDLHLLARSVVTARRRGRRPPFIRFLVALMRPRSSGSVLVTSSNPVAQPSIRLNYLGDPEEKLALERGLVTLNSLVSQPAFAALLQPPEAAFALSSATVTTYQHAVGTCGMGLTPETSVVDQQCLLHGFENVWIGDASVMPRIPGVNTLLTTAMLAERTSDFIAERS